MPTRKLSFKRGTVAQKARRKLAERLKRKGGAANPWAVAATSVKRMSPSKRRKVARSRTR